MGTERVEQLPALASLPTAGLQSAVVQCGLQRLQSDFSQRTALNLLRCAARIVRDRLLSDITMLLKALLPRGAGDERVHQQPGERRP